MENKRITSKEFYDKSQNDEILLKELELREREIALKEKEMEWRTKTKGKTTRKTTRTVSRAKVRIALFATFVVMVAIFSIELYLDSMMNK